MGIYKVSIFAVSHYIEQLLSDNELVLPKMCLSLILYNTLCGDHDNHTVVERYGKLSPLKKAAVLATLFLSIFCVVLIFSTVTGYENSQIRSAREVQNTIVKGVSDGLRTIVMSSANVKPPT